MRILIIDDSKIEHTIIRSFLKDLDYEIFDATTGEQGMKLFSQYHPDLVLLDVMMDEMDGYDVARRIRSQFKNWVPIIFLSGKTKPEDISIGIEAGGDDYLTKPISKQILLAKMKAMERIAAMRNQLIKVTKRLKKANLELERLATKDGLTGIANRRQLDHSIKHELARSRRYAKPLSLIMADIDHFKVYNDYYGHIQGDECLKGIANALKSSVSRPGELVARYGGEEFCVLLPNTDKKNACIVADKLLHAIRKLEYPNAGVNEHALVTISLGIVNTIADGHLTPESLIKAADEKLYQAKKNGRNQWLI